LLFIGRAVLADVLGFACLVNIQLGHREPAETQTAHDQTIRTLDTVMACSAAQPNWWFTVR
jgi:hypothetical protein